MAVVDTIRGIWVHNPMWITWFVVAAYVIFIFIKGVSKVKKIGDADDFLLAGRNVRWFFLLHHGRHGDRRRRVDRRDR